MKVCSNYLGVVKKKHCEIISNIFFLESIDCGIKLLNCCNTPRWRKLGTTKTFLTVLISLAILQGISEKFLSISAQQAALEHDYDPDIIGESFTWARITLHYY